MLNGTLAFSGIDKALIKHDLVDAFWLTIFPAPV
jgi:hypothetical protein